MNILQLPLEEVHPYENNPRKNDNAVDAVAASIKQYGFLVPLVISAEHHPAFRGRAAYRNPRLFQPQAGHERNQRNHPVRRVCHVRRGGYERF